ncbi:MAG: hypothetical protein ACHQ49_10540 [Elusimicrobiota bacterium]
MKELATQVFVHTTYFVLLGVFLAWSALTIAHVKGIWSSWRSFLDSQVMALAVALAVTAAVFVSVPPKFRVLSDETNLLGVSRSMLFDKTVYNRTESERWGGNLDSVNGDLEKRPMLFPFFVSLIHLVRGYDYRNAFVLNFGVLFVFLAGAFSLVKKLAGPVAALAAVLLIVSQPIVVLCASSGGFDLFSILFFGLSFVALFGLLKEPTAAGLAFTWANLLMLAHTRYECALYCVLIVAGLWLGGYLKWSLFRPYAWLYAATPLAAVPLVLQRVLMIDQMENPPGVAAFSLAHFSRNLSLLAASPFDFRFFLPYSNLLSLFAAAAALVIAAAWLRGDVKPLPAHARRFFLILAACCASAFAIVLSYYLGDCTHPTAARLFLSFALAAAAAPTALHVLFPGRFGRRALLLLAAVSVLVYHPVAMEGRLTNTLDVVRENDEAMVFLDKLHDRRILIIHTLSGQYAALGYPAVDFGYAAENKSSLRDELSRHLYPDVYAFQQIAYATQQPVAEQALPPEFKLETVSEIQTSEEQFLRISRVAAIAAN